MVTRIKIKVLVILSLVHGVIYPYTVVPGNSQNTTSTFTFPIEQWIARQDGRIFISAGADGTEDYALSYFDLTNNKFNPIAFEEVTLNGVTLPNPLFNKKIQLLGLIEQESGGLVAVLDDTTPDVYFVDGVRPTSLLSRQGITDAAGQITSGIVAVEGSDKGRAFLAVKPAEGVFGDVDSGINIVGILKVKVASGETESIAIQLGSGQAAVPFDKLSDFLGINGALTTLEAPVPMTWYSDLGFLYVAGNSVIASSASNGARSVALGISNQSGLNTFTIRTVFDVHIDFAGVTNTMIIVTIPEEPLSVHHMKGLSTSTDKSCLIVVGGNGTPEETQRSVYAIPLVPSGNYKGLIANKFDTSKQVFTMDEMVTSDDMQARVGGDALLAGDITNLSVRGETVFVTVAQGEFRGVYYSRPLFDARGEVKAWTAWARATEITESAFASSLELFGDTSFILTSDDPQGANIPNTVVRSTWGEGSSESFAPVVSTLNAYFPSVETLTTGGIGQAYNFADSVAGLDSVSLLAFLGKDRLALVQTGIRDSGVVVPTAAADFIGLANENGTIQTTPTNQTIVMIEGGVLEDVGPLTTIAVAHSNELNDTWICVAGSHGLAILQHADGSGCGSAIGPNFSGVTEGMSFKQFGSYSFVHKLIADNGFLYVLTDTRLDRIALAADVRESTIQTVVEAPVNSLLSQYGVFIDCIISNSLALIATSSALLRIADGSRITDDTPEWTIVPIPEGEIPVMALYAASVDNNDVNVARGVGGHIYVLTGNAYRDLSIINRFAIAGLEEGAAVASDTVLPFTTDKFAPYEDLTYFIDYGEAKNIYATDGASTFAVHNRHGATPTTVVVPTAGLPFAFPNSGNRFVGVKSHAINTTASGSAVIASLVRNSASGVWTLAGTMGLRVLE